MDAVAEFEVVTNTYSAAYGGNGAVINAALRSGTNSLHGSAYEFARNSAMDARNYLIRSAGHCLSAGTSSAEPSGVRS